MDDETNKYSYWNYTQYKQIYKSQLIEALL